jgi:signal transduction histidine kinase
VLVRGLDGAPGPWGVATALLWASLPLQLAAWLRLHRRADESLDPTTLADLAELGARAEAAEAALRRDEELLHELRATVVGITMSHQLLQTSSPDIHDATRHRLTELQNSELARLERLVIGVPERTSSNVDLEDVVRPLAESMEVRGTRVECHGFGAATGRPDDITEIVHVLLANAARHAPGSVVRVTLFQTATTAGIQVADDGPGVPPTLASRLFDRGVRGPDSPGQGLGLHIARKLAREMGGELRLEPGSGGASFELTLPLAIGAVPCLAHSA